MTQGDTVSYLQKRIDSVCQFCYNRGGVEGCEIEGHILLVRTNHLTSNMKEIKNTYSEDSTISVPVVTGRLYKDRVFRMVFKQKPYALALYNAMNGTRYENPEEIQITTLDQSLYMNMKNDVSFVLHDLMSLYEHQSSYNPNMPLRDLFYVSKQYSVQTKDMNLYGKQLVKIPEPKFVVFYNGVEPCPEYQKLRLSDAFLTRTENPQLELIVELYNINKGYNAALLKQCKPLRDYMIANFPCFSYSNKIRAINHMLI